MNRTRTPRPHLTGLERRAIREARRLGLFLVVAFGRTGRRWEVFSRETGRELAIYWPDSRVLQRGEERRGCRDYHEALRLARGATTRATAG